VGVGHDGRRIVSARLVAKHHRAQTQGGHLQIAFAEIAELHGNL
jgi:hypothetical protein